MDSVLPVPAGPAFDTSGSGRRRRDRVARVASMAYKTLIWTGRRAAHHERQRLRRRHINTIGERCNHEARPVPEVLIIIRHDRVTYSYLRPFTTETRLGIPGRISEMGISGREAHHARRRRRFSIFMLELGLPLELRGVAHFFSDQLLDDVAAVRVHRNTNHDARAVLAVEVATRQPNQVRQVVDLQLIIFDHAVRVALLHLHEGVFHALDVVDR